MERYILELPQDSLIITIQRENPPLVFLQYLKSAFRTRVTRAERSGGSIIVLTDFRFHLEDRHILTITKTEKGLECSGSIYKIGPVSGIAVPYHGKTRYDEMKQELSSRKALEKISRTPQQIEEAVNELLGKMTLEEKIGQMSQSGGLDTSSIGNPIVGQPVMQRIEKGEIGSIIHQGLHPELAYALQKQAVEHSRLKIPLIFCQDIIHGYQTVLPIPLAWSCSFDPDAVQKGAAMAAAEASTAGLMYAFSPMLDIARDPRWGRIAESNGEDPYLDGKMAEAVVNGFQGDIEDGYSNDSVAACLKHFVGYGAAEGGRDYNTVEISDTTLHNMYLPPFKAGVEAGASSVMSSFNIMNGEPVSGNEKILKGILREELGFKGVLISDYAAVDEICLHSGAEDSKQAAELSTNASMDIEMGTSDFNQYLPQLVQEGKVSLETIDNAVRRILRLKFALGIMDDPYRYLRPALMEERLFSAEHRQTALEMAEKSIVLLKNEGVLPVRKSHRIAVIGPMADSTDLLGTWQFTDYETDTVTIAQGLRNEGYDVTVTQGCCVHEPILGGLERAKSAAYKADVVILALGEDSSMSGEAASRQSISIPQPQLDLVREVKRTGRPMIAVLINGRPLDLKWLNDNVHGIIEAWFPGSMGGGAIAHVLSGAYNPTAHLSVSFPVHQGQIPVYYNHFSTARTLTDENKDAKFISKYLDGPNEPLFPFGFGLSYSSFQCSKLKLDRDVLSESTPIHVSAEIANSSRTAGKALVQLYIRDVKGSIVRPVKELKGFQQIFLNPGEKKKVSFVITEEMVRFYTKRKVWESEAGEFIAMVGLSSKDEDLLKSAFNLVK